MFGSVKVSDEARRTAFKQAEKKYKLYYDYAFKSSNKVLFHPRSTEYGRTMLVDKRELTSFPQPLNRTNHNAIYGSIHDLFIAPMRRVHQLVGI